LTQEPDQEPAQEPEEEPEGRHAASSSHRTRYIVGGICALVIAAVLVFVLTGGSDGPIGQAVGGTADAPDFHFDASKPKVVMTSADKIPDAKDVAAGAAASTTEALDSFYLEAFLDPANWQEGAFDDAFESFAPTARKKAESQAEVLTAGTEAGLAFDSIEPKRSTLKVTVLLDPQGAPYSTVGVVKFKAGGTGDGGEHVFVSTGQYILQKIDGDWKVVSFSVKRADQDAQPPETTTSSPSNGAST
jgi:hypothetical protein